MLRDSGHVHLDATERKRAVSPLHWEVMLDEIVFLMHLFLCSVKNVSLFVNKCLSMRECINVVNGKRGGGLNCLEFFDL